MSFTIVISCAQQVTFVIARHTICLFSTNHNYHGYDNQGGHVLFGTIVFHIRSSSLSFLDITPTLKRYLPFPLSFTHSSPLNTQTPSKHTLLPPPSFILHRKSLFLIINIQNCSIIDAHSPLQPLYPRERNRLLNIPMAKTRGKGYGLSVVILVVAFLLFDAFCVVFHWRVYARSNPSQVEQYTSSNGEQPVYDQNIDERQWLYVPRWHQHGRTQR